MSIKRLTIVLLLLLSINVSLAIAEVVHIENNEYYQDAEFKEIRARFYYTAGLTEDGRLFTWGNDDYGRLGNGALGNTTSPTDITPLFNLTAGEYITYFDTGNYHMIAATSENRVFTWGWNNNRQIGDGTTVQKNSPFEITSYFSLNVNENIIDVEASQSEGFVITDQGRYFAWGANHTGIIGNNSTTLISTVTDQTSHLTLEVGEYLVDLSATSSTMLALTNLGNLYGWGGNSAGQLFLGDETSRFTNTLLTNEFSLAVGETITAFSAGNYFSVVATSEGDLYTAGYNTYGRLGDGTSISRSVPTNISASLSLNTNEYVTKIDSYEHTIIATNQNRVFGWGYQASSNIGPDLGNAVYTPYEIVNGWEFEDQESIAHVACGYTNSYVVTTQNNFYSWGTNGYGLLGFDFPEISSTSSPIKGPKNFDILKIKEYLSPEVDLLSSRYKHTVLTTTDHRVFVFGDNYFGQLGTGDKLNRITPLDVSSIYSLNQGETFTSIATAERHTVLLTNEHRVFTVGNNQYGQLGTGNYSEQLTPIDITNLLPIDPLDYVVEVYAGGFQSFLLTNDGKVLAMGRSIEGQLTLNIQSQNTPYNITQNLNLNVGEIILKIVPGYRHTLILTNQERILSFGDNSYGQLGNNSIINSTTPVEVITSGCFNPATADIIDLQSGDDFNVLFTTNNDVCTWGRNDNGELGEGGTGNKLSPYSINNQFVLGASENFTKLAVGINHTILYTDLNNTFSWGDGGSYKLGTTTSLDKKFPEDVTANMNIDGNTIDYYVAGKFYSLIKTTEGNLYGFGSNTAGWLGLDIITSALVPTQISRDINLLNDIGFAFMNPNQYIDNSHLYLEIYPQYNIFSELDSIVISGVTYDTSSLIHENGKITVKIPNTYNLGEVVNFTIQTFNFSNGSITPDGPVDVTAVMADDTVIPTFDDIDDQTIEAGTLDIDWTTLIVNLSDNSPGIIILSEVDPINYNVPGDYTVSVTATDESGNQATKYFIVSVEDDPPVLSYDGVIVIEVGGDYNFLLHATAIDDIDGDISNNIQLTSNVDFSTVGTYQINLYVTDSNSNLTSLDVTISIDDTTPPTFDDIDDITFEVGSINMVDWTSYIVNSYDNSGGIITYSYIDNIVYDMPGFYEVTVTAVDPSLNTTSKTFNVILEDTTPPEIYGSGTLTIAQGEYIDFYMYFQAYDDVNGDVSFTIEIDDYEVDYATVGMYQIYVYAYDASNNIAAEIYEVYVIDITPPVFDIINDMTLEFGDYSSYNWLTLVTNLYDNVDPIPEIEVSHDDVNFNLPGSYTVTITASDSSSNVFERSFVVTIIDSNAPSVESIDNQVITVEIDNMDWSTLVIVNDEDIASLDISISDSVTYGTIGIYSVSVTVSDSENNQTIVTFDVSVVDDTSPVINYSGNLSIIIEVGTTWTLPTITCTDNYDDSCIVFVTNPVNTDIIGSYVVNLEATDESGNSEFVNITIYVIDSTAPVVTLNPGIDTIVIGDTWVDSGVTITDLQNTELITTGSVNNTLIGSYTITYTVTDSENNSTIVLRIVNVVESTTNPIFHIEESLTTLDIGEDYIPANCSVEYKGNTYLCTMNTITYDNSLEGTYVVTYSSNINNITFTYKVYVHHIDKSTPILHWYKEDELEVLI